jgi:electron-transferring-flavoprotein dehydrogenase
MLNIQRLKGIHTAMKSGMFAAEAIISAFEKDDFSTDTLGDYATKVENSWIQKELYKARNFTQALSSHGLSQFIHVAAQTITGGRGFKESMVIEEDNSTLKPLTEAGREKIETTALKGLDDELYIDKLKGVYLSGTQHEEDQPCHLIVEDRNICITECYEKYHNPCIRFCPGQVYEMEGDDEASRRLILNPSNCFHCKTCEIKDPFKNITWTCPEGGGGPNYSSV